MDAIETSNMTEQEAIEAHLAAGADVAGLRTYQPDDTDSAEGEGRA